MNYQKFARLYMAQEALDNVQAEIAKTEAIINS